MLELRALWTSIGMPASVYPPPTNFLHAISIRPSWKSLKSFANADILAVFYMFWLSLGGNNIKDGWVSLSVFVLVEREPNISGNCRSLLRSGKSRCMVHIIENKAKCYGATKAFMAIWGARLPCLYIAVHTVHLSLIYPALCMQVSHPSA
jgi:hypothetical protein